MPESELSTQPVAEPAWRTLGEFSLPSEPGNERRAMEQAAALVRCLDLAPARLEQFKTAVAEAVLNAMEHGNQYQPDLPVQVRLQASPGSLVVCVIDQGRGGPISELPAPDLAAKLSGRQSPRGWGLFLIKEMADEMRITSDGSRTTIQLLFYLDIGHCADNVSPEGTRWPEECRSAPEMEGPMLSDNVTLNVRSAGAQTSVIDVQGEVSAAAENALMDAYAQATADGAQSIVLNFEGLDYMNSSGIGLLVTLLIRANRQGHRLLAYGLNRHYRHIFELTRLNEAIRVYEDEAEALAAAAS